MKHSVLRKTQNTGQYFGNRFLESKELKKYIKLSFEFRQNFASSTSLQLMLCNHLSLFYHQNYFA